MFKRLSILIILSLISSTVWAPLGYDADSDVGFSATSAESVETDTTNFDNTLSGTDTDVQKALDTLDDSIAELLASTNTWTGENTFQRDLTAESNFTMTDGSMSITGDHPTLIDLLSTNVGNAAILRLFPQANLTTNNATWVGIEIDGQNLDPSGNNIDIEGINVNMSNLNYSGATGELCAIRSKVRTLADIAFCTNGKYNAEIDASGTANGDVNAIFDVTIDKGGSTGGEVHVLEANEVGVGTAFTSIIGAYGETTVIHQHAGVFEDMDWGGDFTGSNYYNHTPSYTSVSVDGVLVPADNDFILIADTNKFDAISVDLETESIQDVFLEFYYGDGSQGWTQFSPNDGTNGFKDSGLVIWDTSDLTGWGTDTVNEITGLTGAVNYYWIKIVRTRNVISITPVENLIQVLESIAYQWDGNGEISVYTVSATTVGTTGDITSGATVYGKAGNFDEVRTSTIHAKSPLFINSSEIKVPSGATIDSVDVSELAVSTGTANRPITLVVGFTKDCDYICDGASDHVQIQSALTALTALGGGTVLLREGTYDCDGAGQNLMIAVTSTTIMGVGDATVLSLNNDQNLLLISSDNCKLMNLAIDCTTGDGNIVEVDAANCVIQNCLWNNLATTSGHEAYLNIFATGLNALVIGNRFLDSTQPTALPIIKVQGHNTIVTNNYIETAGDGIYGITADNVTVIGNRIIAVSEGINISNANCDNWMISGNNFQGCGTEITDSGTGTQIRNNLDKNGAWLAETSPINMGGQNLENAGKGSFTSVISSGPGKLSEIELTNGATAAGNIDAGSFTGNGPGLTNLSTAPCASSGNKNTEYSFDAGSFDVPNLGGASPYEFEYEIGTTSYPAVELRFSSSTDQSAFKKVKFHNEYDGGNITFKIDYYCDNAEVGNIEFNVEVTTATGVKSTKWDNNAFGLFSNNAVAYEINTATLTISSNKPVAGKEYRMRLWVDVSDTTYDEGSIRVRQMAVDFDKK